ncbi:hypothetical protein [Crocosphaera sp. XPORK-15E]|uniref:hypothetical protein n=1 Tax=Crocosphaera sp. XPORK-15E TaxID=3110247 RepID=UPI002B206D16|nr:hypothetical protein [Crocosphaera sp. XPORK-15E]MEA5534470.1 hypothetical protein [Crocosphaera sp. XPORK-15E]
MANIRISDINLSEMEENYLLTNLSEQEMEEIVGGGFLGKLIGGVVGGVVGFFVAGPVGAIAGVGAGATLGDATQEVIRGNY